ncbi:MAG: YggS family pyridoxal phosphate-dependent enzyme [Lewinellaceae bacterium]|nr:YggS family pyridoxal phosphate-dependent enzyme [Saprospiraceae bacterium]MCB9339525.1 YggS family pyridoxal phosphate-dependent enzyme [Lewinellaceae bacterium]
MLESILQQLPPQTRLVAVSKTKPLAAILALYQKGQRIFGENRAQELAEKYEALPKDIEWHLIGHLQTNKVRYIAPFVACIHSVDSLKLLLEIDKQAQKNNRSIDCLLQFHIASEETKFGLDRAEAEAILLSAEFSQLRHIRITGVMGMATFTDNTAQVRREFKSLKAIFDHLKATFFANAPYFREISMGMSGDYQIAIAEGSTLVRIGTLLFGERG